MILDSPIRILTVDDHPVLRRGIAAILAGELDMVLVGEASNGREAIEQFRTHCPNVTLMDLQMPEMNGIDAILAIREDFPNARIIVLTTYSNGAGIRISLEEHGAKGTGRNYSKCACGPKKNSLRNRR